MAQRLTTVFFGSGPVALESLRLLAQYFELEAIVTKPATKSEMEREFTGAPVFSASRRAEIDTLCAEQKFRSRFGLVIDFGAIIDQYALDSFPMGIINSHFSLLPQWRGVDPITFAVLSGQKQTGVSLMRLVRAWDEGPLLAQAIYDMPPDITTPALTHDLIELSNQMLVEIVPKYLKGEIDPAPQAQASLLGPIQPSYSRKLTKADGAIDWQKPASILEREVRAYVGWPQSYTKLAGKEVIVTRATVAELSSKPGEVIFDKQHLYVCCGEQALEILALKPAGKPEMTASAFLAGHSQRL